MTQHKVEDLSPQLFPVQEFALARRGSWGSIPPWYPAYRARLLADIASGTNCIITAVRVGRYPSRAASSLQKSSTSASHSGVVLMCNTAVCPLALRRTATSAGKPAYSALANTMSRTMISANSARESGNAAASANAPEMISSSALPASIAHAVSQSSGSQARVFAR